MMTLKELAESNIRYIVAHRGSSGTAPENTLSAFEEAIKAGAKMVETDVQLSSDNKIIAYHDFDLQRTGSLKTNLNSLTLDELKKIDIGSWFSEKFIGERIPTLDELIETVKGRACIMLEIKSRMQGFDSEKATLIYDQVKKHNFLEYTLFGSFDYHILAHIKQLNPQIHTAAIKIPDQNYLPSEICSNIGCSAFVCAIEELNEEIINDARSKNIYLGAYSADNEEQLDKILNYDVKAIVTNYPAKIQSLLKKKGLA